MKQTRKWTAFGSAMLAGLMGLAGCRMFDPDKLSNDELAREFYDAQIQTIEMLSQTFLRLSQEYYTLSVEYRNLNQSEMAGLTLQKAEMFQRQHQEFNKRVEDLQVRRARALRGESPSEEPPQPATMPAPKPTLKSAPKSGLIQTKPAPPKPAAPPAPPEPPVSPSPASEPESMPAANP